MTRGKAALDKCGAITARSVVPVERHHRIPLKKRSRGGRRNRAEIVHVAASFGGLARRGDRRAFRPMSRKAPALGAPARGTRGDQRRPKTPIFFTVPGRGGGSPSRVVGR